MGFFHKWKPRPWHATTIFILTTFSFLATFLDMCREPASASAEGTAPERHRDVKNHNATELFWPVGGDEKKMNITLTIVRRRFAVSK